MPVSLDPAFLILIFGLSAALSIASIILTVLSAKNGGLSDIKNNVTFVLNFVPTLISVIYALFWAAVLSDVLRTDPWAILSLPNGGPASSTISRGSEFVWKTVVFAFKNRKKAGGIRWALLLAILCNGLASLVINPLSAGLFDLIVTTITSQQEFSTIDFPASVPLVSDIDEVTYIKAIGNIQYNISTSAWISSKYIVSPFWPKGQPGNVFGSQTPVARGSWIGNTTVFAVDFDCQPFTSVLPNNQTPDFALVTDDGCTMPVVDNLINPYTNLKSDAVWGRFNASTQ
jgi:hypothetical protein